MGINRWGALMPKPKPDEVIRHELVLGRSERDLLETATTAFTVNRVLAPFATLLSSTAGVLLVAGLVLAYLERFLPEDWAEMTETQVFDWFETENLVVGGVFAGLGGLFGSIFGFGGAAAGAAAGGVYGGIAQELAEEGQEAGVPKVLSYSQFSQIYVLARRLNNLIKEQENAS